MKLHHKLFYMLLGALLVIAIPMFATAIDVETNTVNIVVNGIKIASIGENMPGTTTPYSILYNGTTYLPMRKLGELLDFDIDWDSDTRTVGASTSKAPGATPSQSASVPNNASNTGQSEIYEPITKDINGTMVEGVRYQGKEWFPTREIAEATIEQSAFYVAPYNNGTPVRMVFYKIAPLKPGTYASQVPLSERETELFTVYDGDQHFMISKANSRGYVEYNWWIYTVVPLYN